MLPDLLSKLLKTFLLHEPSSQALERDSFFNYANNFLNGNTLEQHSKEHFAHRSAGDDNYSYRSVINQSYKPSSKFATY